MVGKKEKIDTKQKYVFKSLLRQDYFNARFKENSLPPNIMNKGCQKEVNNFILMSEFLLKVEEVTYSEDITGDYLLKYFPYQCSVCEHFTNQILISKCSQDDTVSCNKPVCLKCSLEMYDLARDDEIIFDSCPFCDR